MRWSIQLTTGPKLRAAISAAQSGSREDVASVMDALMNSVKEVVDNALTDRAISDFEEFEGVIDGEGDLIRTNNPLIQEMGFDGPVDLVDGRIDEFYDLCDRHHIWVNVSCGNF